MCTFRRIKYNCGCLGGLSAFSPCVWQYHAQALHGSIAAARDHNIQLQIRNGQLVCQPESIIEYEERNGDCGSCRKRTQKEAGEYGREEWETGRKKRRVN
jgi:hypothetical protein